MGSCTYVSGTLWVSPTNSTVRLGVSPTAASTPTGVFNQWFEALLALLEPWVVQSVSLPSCSSQFICTRMWDCPLHQPPAHRVHQLLPCLSATALPAQLHNPPHRWVCQLPPCSESSPPGCPSLVLLLIWMSSLTPWLLDFHTI